MSREVSWVRIAEGLSEPWKNVFADFVKGDTLDTARCATVDKIDLEDLLVIDLEPLEFFPNLRQLNISSTRIRDLRPLINVPRLEMFYADFSEFEDLGPLAQLAELREVDITCSLAHLTNVFALSECRKLEKAYLAHSPITSIKPLFELPSLELLSVTNTEIPEEELKAFRKLHPTCVIWS